MPDIGRGDNYVWTPIGTEIPVILPQKRLPYFGGGAEWLGAATGDPRREERGFRFDLAGFSLIRFDQV